MPGSVVHLRSVQGDDPVLSAAVSNVADVAAEVVVPADALVAAGWFQPARTLGIRMRRNALGLPVAAIQDCLVPFLKLRCHIAFVHRTNAKA